MTNLPGDLPVVDAHCARVTGMDGPVPEADARPVPADSQVSAASKDPGRKAPTNARRLGHRPRRPISSAVLHAPQVLRAMVRADEIWLVALAAFMGCGTGVAVWLMTETTQMVHEVLFGIARSQRLSAMDYVEPWRTVVVPCMGGLALGLVSLGLLHLYPRRTVDPIEANALFGGRMSMSGSL